MMTTTLPLTIHDARERFEIEVVVRAEDLARPADLDEILGVAPGSAKALLTPSMRAKMHKYDNFPAAAARGYYPTAAVRAWKAADDGEPIEQIAAPLPGRTYTPLELLDLGIVVAVRPDDLMTTAQLGELIGLDRNSISSQLAIAARTDYRDRVGPGPTPWKLLGLPPVIVPGIRDRRACMIWHQVKSQFHRPAEWRTMTAETYAEWQAARILDLEAAGIEIVR